MICLLALYFTKFLIVILYENGNIDVRSILSQNENIRRLRKLLFSAIWQDDHTKKPFRARRSVTRYTHLPHHQSIQSWAGESSGRECAGPLQRALLKIFGDQVKRKGSKEALCRGIVAASPGYRLDVDSEAVSPELDKFDTACQVRRMESLVPSGKSGLGVGLVDG